MSIFQIMLLAAGVLVMPLILVAGLCALSWSVLYLVRFIPLIGRKHRAFRLGALLTGRHKPPH